MQAEMEICGEDVIGRPGQMLSGAELRLLVGLADGETPNQIGQVIGADKNTFRHLEASIKAKLGAKTHPHMIARGFTLGVLFPRALCMLLAFLSAADDHHDAMRNRSQRRSRSPVSSERVARARPSGGRGFDKPKLATQLDASGQPFQAEALFV